ncbi:MAG: potassium transporter TrkG [Clostridia bacterium]|nr:potassium transporter TrkG [Clostridia bacterium]
MAHTRRRAMRPVVILPLGFLCIILAGACLLSLPAASNDGEALPFFDALFTATSATCVTGLVVRDTATQFTVFGRGVILLMIQVGGLGFMTLAAMAFSFFRVPSPQQVAPVAEAFGEDRLDKAYHIAKQAVLLTLCIEAIGVSVLLIRFIPMFEGDVWRATGHAVFHSVSAFCNAGFDLMGGVTGPYSSMTAFVADPLVSVTLMALIILGGMGFAVILAVANPKRRLSLSAKIVLVSYAAFFVGGTLLVLLTEYSNPDTIGNMPFWQKLLAAAFQSVTCRTAGFNTIDQAALNDSTKVLSSILMFVGGAPAGTAGGVKVTTVAVAFLTLRSLILGREEVFAFSRSIKAGAIRRSLSIIMLAVSAAIISTIAISFAQQLAGAGAEYVDVLYETMSAIGTVGLSAGLTATSTAFTRALLMALMFLGRLGPLTIAVSVARPSMSAGRYVEENVIVG